MPNYGVQARPAPEPPIRFDGHHVHDFEMEFPNADYPLDYELRCSCGATAADMSEAIRLTNLSRRGPLDIKKIGSYLFLAAATVFLVWAIGRGHLW